MEEKTELNTEIETEQDGRVIINMPEKAQEILRRAQEKGVEHSFMFITAFQRYLEILDHMKELQKILKTEDLLITKEYVKGRKNIYVNPALAAYNQSSGAADKTAALLMKCIIAPLSNGGDDGDEFDTF